MSEKGPGFFDKMKYLGEQAKKGFKAGVDKAKNQLRGSGYKEYHIAPQGHPSRWEKGNNSSTDTSGAIQPEVLSAQDPRGEHLKTGNTGPKIKYQGERHGDFDIIDDEATRGGPIYIGAQRQRKALPPVGTGKEVILRPSAEVINTGKDVILRQSQDLERIPGKHPHPIEPHPKPIEYPEHHERVVIADITSVVDRYARTLAEKKIQEQITQSGFKWFGLKKAYYRLSEAGYAEKYFQEAKAEILKNKNLMSEIEARFARKSTGKTLRTGDEDLHYDVLDKVIEAYDQDVTETGETKKEHHNDPAVDAAFAGLIVQLCSGRISGRKQFEEEVEARIIKPYLGSELKTGNDRMYASNLFNLAEKYVGQYHELQAQAGKEFGPKDAEHFKNYLERTIKLDVKLGEKGADLYQKRPEAVMKWYEKVVDFTQNGTFFKGTKVGRVLGKIIANPVTYAMAGGLGVRCGARALGVAGAATAFGGATALLIGAGVGAGVYLGIRGARERRRDIMRREQEAALGQRGSETHKLENARALEGELTSLLESTNPLTPDQMQRVAEIQARVDLQSKYGVDLIGTDKAEGAQYKTKFLAETDLRIALKKLMNDKLLSFGSDSKTALANYRKMIGQQERVLADEIEKVNKEVARDIKIRGAVVGVFGGAITIAAGAIAPWLKEKALEGIDYVLDTHWASHKTQYIEEAWHRISDSFRGGGGHEVFQGGLADQAHGIAWLASSSRINLPPGFNLVDQTDPSGNHFFGIRGPNGTALDRVACDSSGKILDMAGFKARLPGWQIAETAGAAGSGGKALSSSEWLSSMKGKISGGNIEQIHTKNYYDNPIPGEGTHAHNLNELKFFINKDSAGDFHYKVPIQEGDSWLPGGKMAEVGKAFSEGRIKMLFIPDGASPHDAIVLDVDAATHEVIIPKGSNLEKLFDPATGRPKGTGFFGLAEQTSVRADGSKDYIWINSERNSGGLIDYGTDGTTVLGKPGAVDLRPPITHDMDNPWILAGYRREKDKDLDKRKKEHGKDGKKPEAHSKKPEQSVVGEAKKEAALETAPAGEVKEGEVDKAFEEIKEKLDKNELTEEELLACAKKHKVEDEKLLDKCLEHKKVDFKKRLKEIDELMKESEKKGLPKIIFSNADMHSLKMAMLFGAMEKAKASSAEAQGGKSAETDTDASDDAETKKKKQEVKGKMAEALKKGKPKPSGKGKPAVGKEKVGKPAVGTGGEKGPKPVRGEVGARRRIEEQGLIRENPFLKGVRFGKKAETSQNKDKQEALSKLNTALRYVQERANERHLSLPKNSTFEVILVPKEGNQAKPIKKDGKIIGIELPMDLRPGIMADKIMEAITERPGTPEKTRGPIKREAGSGKEKAKKKMVAKKKPVRKAPVKKVSERAPKPETTRRTLKLNAELKTTKERAPRKKPTKKETR